MGEWSSSYGYQAAQGTTGRRLEVRGPTYQNRQWLNQQGGTFDKPSQTWRLPMPSNNRALAALLYEIVQRGLEWRSA